MTSAPATKTEQLEEERFKMRLRQEEVMVTATGTTRYPAGAVVIVDKTTAKRWHANQIAAIAPPDAESYGEISRRLKDEEFERLAVAIDEGSFDQAITRGSFNGEQQLMPRPMPVPQRRGPGRPRKDLEGAVLNERMDDDEDGL